MKELDYARAFLVGFFVVVYSCYVVTFVESVLIDFLRHDFSSAQTLSAGLAVVLECPRLNVGIMLTLGTVILHF